jgi:carbon monoxide dehydrogenase subunit G
MSMKFTGTVEVTEKDEGAHRAVMVVKSKEEGGQGHANAEVAFQLRDGGGTINTRAQITGKAASMGEGVVHGVLDALINDFTSKLGKL